MEMTGSSECHKLSCCLCVCSWTECWTCFYPKALPPFCRAERGSTGVRMAGCSFAQVVPTAREGSGFAWVLPTALVCVRGKFSFCREMSVFPVTPGAYCSSLKATNSPDFLSHALTQGLSFLNIFCMQGGLETQPSLRPS